MSRLRLLLVVLSMTLASVSAHARLVRPDAQLQAMHQARDVVIVDVTQVQVVWARAHFKAHGVAVDDRGPDRLLTLATGRTTDNRVVTFALLGGAKGDIVQRAAGAGHVDVGQRVLVLLGKEGPGGIRRVQGHGAGIRLIEDGHLFDTEVSTDDRRRQRLTAPKVQDVLAQWATVSSDATRQAQLQRLVTATMTSPTEAP